MKFPFLPSRSFLAAAIAAALAAAAPGQTTLYTVQPLDSTEHNAQGATPEYLTDGGDGYIYGVMIQGGTNGAGTLFKMKRDGSTFGLLHTFGAASDGYDPYNIAVSGTTLYGITYFGGTSNSNPIAAGGTVYRINTDGTNYQVIQNFSGFSGVAYHPSTLALSPDGSTLVMEMGSNTSFGNQCVCSLPTSAGTGTALVNLYNFANTDQNGAFGPAGRLGNLVFSPDSKSVYGVGVVDGANGAGLVYRITLATGAYASLHDFSANNAQNTDGATPQGPLAISADGSTVYGVALKGGSGGGGTLFSVSSAGGAFTVLHSFPAPSSSAGSAPNSVVLIGGSLCGSTSTGGSQGTGTLWQAILGTTSGSADGGRAERPEAGVAFSDIAELFYGFIQGWDWFWDLADEEVVGGNNVSPAGNGGIIELTVSATKPPPSPLTVTSPKDVVVPASTLLSTVGTTQATGAGFSVVAGGGTPPYSYQWFASDTTGLGLSVKIQGATGPNLSLSYPGATLVNAGPEGLIHLTYGNFGLIGLSSGSQFYSPYFCVVTDSGSPTQSVASGIAAIDIPPYNVSISNGFGLLGSVRVSTSQVTPVQFNVSALGSDALAYQWFFDGVPAAGAPGTAASETGTNNFVQIFANGLSAALTSSPMTVKCTVTNPYGSASSSYTLNFSPPIPQLSTFSLTLKKGASTTITLKPINSLDALVWNVGGVPVIGATGPNFTFTPTATSSVTATETTGVGATATSAPVIIYVNTPGAGPTITRDPAAAGPIVSFVPGDSVTLGALASASSSVMSHPSGKPGTLVANVAAVSYQWQFNGANIAGATSPTLTISNATAASAGTYACVATDPTGTTATNPVMMSLAYTADLGRLANLSARANAGAGSQTLVVGFVVGGTGTAGEKTLLVRGDGPLLTQYGVVGALAQPSLGLYGGTTLVASNTGWSTAANAASVASVTSSIGANALPSGSADSALVSTLPAGAYTAQVTGLAGGTGVALAEVYDALPYVPGFVRLVNLSARVQVGTGANILDAGFVIQGSTAETVLIRASGPALTPFGVTGVLADPALQLFNSGSQVIAANTGWGADPNIVNAANQVGAFSWGSAATADSAILVTLPPGSYTAQVAGASNDTGVALIEVYEVR